MGIYRVRQAFLLAIALIAMGSCGSIRPAVGPAAAPGARPQPLATAGGQGGNDTESRYIEYTDSPGILSLKLAQLDYINRSRAAYGAPPVALDILASRVANRMSREAAAGNFMGHWNTRGEKPYQRYAFAGGRDHVSENAAASWSSASFAQTDQSYAALMRQAHDSFMAEIAPNDGHKKNCIDPRHTHVGIGVAIDGGQFRYYEEYVDRYLEFGPVKTELAVNEETKVPVSPLRGGDIVYAVIVYYEPLPVPMTPAQINRMGSYPDFTGSQAIGLWPWDLEKYKNGKVYSIPVRFTRPGSYYMNIYVSDTPYTSGRAATEGKIQGSGVVFRVD
jgi:uncharacterized protein YkwD